MLDTVPQSLDSDTPDRSLEVADWMPVAEAGANVAWGLNNQRG